MKKEIMYLLELLIKNEQTEVAQMYRALATGLENALLYAPSCYTLTKIHALMRHNGYSIPQTNEEAIKRVDTLLETLLPEHLILSRKSILQTLLKANFPKKKSFLEYSLGVFESQLDPVEKSIYQNILAYTLWLNRALSLFYSFGKKSTPETFISFSQALHVNLLETIFNDDEKTFLAQGLQELMGVYVGLYGKYLYEERSC